MPEQVPRRVEARQFAVPNCVSEPLGVPVDDDRRKKVEPGDAKALDARRPIADLALAPDPRALFSA